MSKLNKIEVCVCGHNRSVHIPMCCEDLVCKCKRYKRKETINKDTRIFIPRGKTKRYSLDYEKIRGAKK